MPDEAVQNEEQRRAAKLRQKQNSARRLEQAGQVQKVAGRGMRIGGKVADQAGDKVRKGGQKMMQTGAKMSGSLVGAIGGIPLMAAGGAAALTGGAVQGIGKAAKGTGRGLEKGGRVAKLKARAVKKKIAKKKEEGGLASNLEKKATGGLLKSAWFSLIPSWGFTLIYINIHVFLSWIFPKQFCKLGQEWPKKVSGGGFKKVAVGWGENMLLLGLDLIVLFAIFGIVAIVIWVADAGPADLIQGIFSGLNS